MKTSLLTVTNRPDMFDWWLWNIEKQSIPPDEIVLVTNHAEPQIYQSLIMKVRLSDIKLVSLPVSVTIGEMRQCALSNSTNEVILWADDDDWYHPEHFERLAAPLITRYKKTRIVLHPFSHHLILSKNELWSSASLRDPYLPSLATYAEDVKGIGFPSISIGEDTEWRKILKFKLVEHMRIDTSWLEPNMNCMHIEHGRNISSEDDTVSNYLRSIGCVCRKFPKYPPPNVTDNEWVRTIGMLKNHYRFTVGQ